MPKDLYRYFRVEARELLDPHRDGGAPLPSPKINDVLGRLDAIGGRLSALEPPRPEPSAAPSSSPPAPADDAITSVRVEIADLDSLLHGVSEAMVQLTALRRAVARAGGGR